MLLVNGTGRERGYFGSDEGVAFKKLTTLHSGISEPLDSTIHAELQHFISSISFVSYRTLKIEKQRKILSLLTFLDLQS